MFRGALTHLLIIAVAVGPLLCCCSAGKASAPVPVTAPDHVRVERQHSCCSHKQTEKQSSVPAKPNQPHEKCPCKDASDQTPTVQAEAVQGGLATFLRLLGLDAATSFDSLLAVLVAPSPEPAFWPRGSECPRLTAAEILYAHHNLRC